MEFHDYSNPYPLGWATKDVNIKVTEPCRIKFDISAYYIYEVDIDVIPLYVYGVMFGSTCMYLRD
jgi:hypothetical protein